MLRILDIGERGVLLLLFVSLLVRVLAHPDPGFFAYLLVFAEGVTVSLILFRRSTLDVTLRPVDWAFAFAGTMLPLLVTVGGDPLAPSWVGSTMMVAGLGFSLWAKVALWRSFGLAAANRGVKVRGPYRLVRHPMYLGYFLVYAGFLLLNPTLRNLMIYAGWLACQVIRVYAEERQLEHDPAYREYKTKVRSRLIPGLF